MVPLASSSVCFSAQSHIFYLSSESVGQKIGMFCSFVALEDRSGQRFPKEWINASAGLRRGLLTEDMGSDKAGAGGRSEGVW